MAPLKVLFYPTPEPPFWSKIYVGIHRLGYVIGTRADHDLRILFSGRTIDKDGIVLDRQGRRRGKTTKILHKTINGRCNDVSKTRVDRVFARVFGYSSLVDPRKHESVQKTEIQAIHDIRRVKKMAPKRGYIYQRLIDTRDSSGRWTDLRPLVFDGKIHTVCIKRKPEMAVDRRAKMSFHMPIHVFTKAEREKILEFAAEFGADCADIDVLRDRKTKKLYIVDVNHTAHKHAFKRIGELQGESAQREAELAYAKAFEAAFARPKWRVR